MDKLELRPALAIEVGSRFRDAPEGGPDGTQAEDQDRVRAGATA